MKARVLENIAADYIHLAQDEDGKVDKVRQKRHAQLLQLAQHLRNMPQSHRFSNPAAFAIAFEKWCDSAKRS